MNGDQPHAAACDHIGGNRAVNPAGKEGHRNPVGAHRHAARSGDRVCMHIGRHVPYLHMHREIRVVHIHRRVGIGLLQLPTHILA